MHDVKTETYIEVIEALKLIVKPITTDFSVAPYFPQVVLTDFEQAVMNAFRHCFPGIITKGCYFYFKHAHQGWLSRNSWKKTYRENKEFRI